MAYYLIKGIMSYNMTSKTHKIVFCADSFKELHRKYNYYKLFEPEKIKGAFFITDSDFSMQSDNRARQNKLNRYEARRDYAEYIDGAELSDYKFSMDAEYSYSSSFAEISDAYNDYRACLIWD